MADHIPSSIPQSAVDTARNLLNQGDVAGAWEVLSNAGDRYADNAAGVLGANRDAADSFFSKRRADKFTQSAG